MTASTPLHEAILAALIARDGDRLGGILRDHLRNKCETVKDSLLMEAAGGPINEAGSADSGENIALAGTPQLDT